MISVVICTYNRANLLNDLLQTVCQQTLPPSAYEVIVVDNNSTDETPAVCRSYAERYPNVHIYVELQQGLSYARNRGWQEATGTYVAYVDDDCKVTAEWLTVAQAVIEDVAPDVFGGPYLAFYNTPKPAWFKDEYGSHTPYDGPTKIAGPPDELHGGNLFLRRELLAQVGGFNPQLGMVGGQVAYGEETALLRYLCAIMPEILVYYEPTLIVHHLVRPAKMTWRWLIPSEFTKGEYVYHVCYAGQVKKLPRLILIAWLLCVGAGLLWDIVVLSQLRSRTQQPRWRHYLYESSLGYVKTLGVLYARLHDREPRADNNQQVIAPVNVSKHTP